MKELPADPWQWPDLTTVELQKLSESDPGTGPDTPLFQYSATRWCNALRAKIDGGSGFAVLAAVRICATHGLVMPLWLVYAFNRRYDAVLSCRAASWDDPQSFGRPYPKGANIHARRKARLGRFAVFNAVHELLAMEPETPIDKDMFERIGGPLGLGITLTEEYYYSAQKMFGYRAGSPANFRKFAGIGKRRK